ncbi:MAG: TIGR02587 family membrane protein [Microthrixaceae bacterium]
MTAASAVDQRGPWATEGVELVAAASGGLLFGIPMLMTMEVWWTGSHTTPLQAAGVLVLTSIPVFLLNRTSGFRSTRDVRVRDAVMDTVEAVALGLVLVTVVLYLLRELTPDTPISVAIGKAVYEAFPFCLGISVANHFLRGERTEGDDDEATEASPDGGLSATAKDIGATVIGSVFVALNIAPTDEVPMIAAALDPLGILALMAASLAVSYGIVFGAGFSRQDQRRQHTGLLQSPASETVSSYLVALACAALMLLMYQRLGGPWTLTLDKVVVLGLPASIGGAAGRLAM